MEMLFRKNFSSHSTGSRNITQTCLFIFLLQIIIQIIQTNFCNRLNRLRSTTHGFLAERKSVWWLHCCPKNFSHPVCAFIIILILKLENTISIPTLTLKATGLAYNAIIKYEIAYNLCIRKDDAVIQRCIGRYRRIVVNDTIINCSIYSSILIFFFIFHLRFNVFVNNLTILRFCVTFICTVCWTIKLLLPPWIKCSILNIFHVYFL